MTEDTVSAVLEIAWMAGNEILRIYRHLGSDISVQVQHKSDETPVTEADLIAHHLIVESLARLTPGLCVFSEEDHPDQHLIRSNDVFWLIDPLDGTKEFLAKNGEFTINIALIVGGEPVWGVVHAPLLGTTYWGGRHHKTQRKNHEQIEKIQVDSNRRDQPLRVVASKSHLNLETKDFIHSLGLVELVQAGSSLKFCRVAEGRADIYPRLAPTSEWDTAAAQAVLEGAGGYLFDIQGGPLRYGKTSPLNPFLIASNISYDMLRAHQLRVMPR